MQSRRKIINIVVLAAMCAVLFAGTALAQPSDVKLAGPGPVTCDDPNGSGKRFYDFDRFVIYYADFPSRDDEESPPHAEALKYENFNNSLIAAIKKNFVACLKTADGKEKPIFSAERQAFPKGREGQREFFKVRKLAWDPKSLTIIVSLQYQPWNSGQGVGLLSVAIHRTGLTGIESLPLIGNRFTTIILAYDKEEYSEELKGLWHLLRPHNDGEPGSAQGGVTHMIDWEELQREQE